MAAVSLLFVQSLASSLNPCPDGLQVRELRKNHCLAFKASPQGALQDGRTMAG